MKAKWDKILQMLRESDEAALGGAFVYGYDNDTAVTSGANQFKAVVLNQDNASYTYPANGFSQMPCHGKVRPCVMSDCANRTVAYYLNPSDINKKLDGTASDLTGNDGDVMAEFEPCYYRIDQYTDGNSHVHDVFLMSVDQFPGAAYWPGFYISDGGATVRKQYVGIYPGYITGGKLHSWSGVQPTVNTRCDQFITAGVANGGNQVNDLMYQWVFHLMITELASCNSQTDVAAGHAYMTGNWKASWVRKTGRANSVPYKGGVLADESTGGADVDLIPDWGGTIKSETKDWTRTPASDGASSYAWKNGSAFRYTASAAPHAGDTTYSDNTLTTSADTVTSYTANKCIACKYAYIENLWGSIWENTSGTQKYQDGTELDITSDGVKYYRYEAGDVTDEHDTVTGFAWKSDADVTIYTAVSHPAVGAVTYSDGACTTARTGKNITVFDEDFTQSGYWFTTDTSKYGLLADKDHTLPPGPADSAFPALGYTPGSIAWVSHPWPKGSGYPSKWNPRTLYPTNASGGAAESGLTDNFYNDANNGARALFRDGHATYGAYAGLGSVHVTSVVGYAHSSCGGRLSA